MFRMFCPLALIVAIPFAACAERIDAFFDSDGVQIHYQVSGEGEPVVLLHGIATSITFNWGGPGIIAKLEPDFQVIALDARGHGKSGKPHDPSEYGDKMVTDVINLLDHLAIERAHVAGYSMGGFITTKLLIEYPGRVISAVAGGSGMLAAGDESDPLWVEMAKALESGDGLAPLLEFLEPKDGPKQSPEQREAISNMLLAMNDPLALAAVIRGMGGLAVTQQELKDSRVPTLAIIGSRDPIKASTDELAASMSNLEVVVLEGADHMTAIMNPSFVSSMRSFMMKHALEAPATDTN